MKRLASPLFLAVLAFGGIAWGCGGGGARELTLEEYFYRLEVVINDEQDRAAEVFQQYPEAPDDIEALRDFWDAVFAIEKDTAKGLEKLNPPAEAQAAHDEFVAAVNALRGVNEEYQDILAEAESIEEVETAEASAASDLPDVDELMHRESDACFALADIASENNVDVYLQCPSVD